MAKSPKNNKYKVVIGALRLADVGDGKEKTPYEMSTPATGHDSSSWRNKFSEEARMRKLAEDDSSDSQDYHLSWQKLFPNSSLGSRESFESVKNSAKQHNVPLEIVAGVFAHETGQGTSHAWNKRNNPGGIMDPKTNWSKLKKYDKVDDGINDAVKTISKNYNDRAKGDLNKMGRIYAPVGAENDPQNQNKDWVPGVSKYIKDFRSGLGLSTDMRPSAPVPAPQTQALKTTSPKPIQKPDQAPPPAPKPTPQADQSPAPKSTQDTTGMTVRQRFNKAYAAAKADPSIGKGGTFDFEGKKYNVDEALKDRRFLANKKPVKTPTWRKPLDQWQDRVNKAVDSMDPKKEVKSEQREFDKFGHETKKPKSAKETLSSRFKLGRAKHTPHPAPIRGGEYKQTPQMERPHYEETKMKTLPNFMAEARAKADRDDDDRETGVESGAKKHIIHQLRKVISMRGEHHVEFKDGNKVKLTPAIAHKALEMHDNMKRPSDKEEFTHHISHSLEHMKSGLKGNWKAEKKPKITLAGPKLRKEEQSTVGRVARAVMSGVAPVLAAANPLAGAMMAASSTPANKGEPDYVKQNVAKQKAKDTNRDKMASGVAEDTDYSGDVAGTPAGKKLPPPKVNTPPALAPKVKFPSKIPLPPTRPSNMASDETINTIKKDLTKEEAEIEEGKSSMARPKLYSDTMKKATKFSNANIAAMIRDKKAENAKMKDDKKVSEDYAPMKAGKALQHPDDANSPADSKKRKMGGDKPTALKDPAKYITKEAREFYEGLSDENKAVFNTMSLDEIAELLGKYEEHQ